MKLQIMVYPQQPPPLTPVQGGNGGGPSKVGITGYQVSA